MPHECTSCGTLYPNGTEAILKGCPDCGWNRFRYIPDSEVEEEKPSEGPEPESSGETVETSRGREILDRLERAHEDGGKDLDEALEEGDISSIQMMEEGSYRINVSSLMEKEEVIMSVGESGRYLVDLGSAFGTEREETERQKK